MRTPTLRHTVLASAIALAGLVSCAPGVREEPRAPDARRDPASELWQATCDGDADPRRCGLLTDQFTSTWGEKFVREACQQNPKQDVTDECRAAMHKNIVAALSRRYARATTSDVSEECGRRAAEGYCENFVNLERVFLATHNRAVYAAVESQQRSRWAMDSQRAARIVTSPLETHSPSDSEHDSQRAARTRIVTSLPETHSHHDLANGECFSDSDCGGSGMRCAKGAGKSSGTCARAVDAHGSPVAGPSIGGGLGPGTRQCFSPSDCAPGFKCDDGRCMR